MPYKSSSRDDLSDQQDLLPKGSQLLHNPVLNKGSAFSEEEREALHLRGLLPAKVTDIEEQVQRCMGNLRRKTSDIEKYIFLSSLQERNQTLFYRVVMDHIQELMPIVYTPTVGRACQEYAQIYRQPQGVFVTSKNKGRIRELLGNWPYPNVKVIVVTDGERILGLGDLGMNGMGIPVGKLALYTVCAGIDPLACLPVTLDVGTDNESLLNDPLYMGIAGKRLRGSEYDEIIEEFIGAVKELYPQVLLQFEDFANRNAFRLLKKYRKQICTFNDDIQGTASVALAGIYSAIRITGKFFRDQKILFLGAGEAGIGIGELIAAALTEESLSPEEARQRCLFFDTRGLVVKSRSDLQEHKKNFAHDLPFTDSFEDAIRTHRPTAIIGASGMPQAFTPAVLQAMAEINDRPVVFALSNPTANAECTAEEAYAHTGGRAVFASGSPFPKVMRDGKTFVPGQGNNAYIFPGVGLGVTACQAKEVTDEMFFAAARTLAGLVGEEDLARGCIYPDLSRIREVSLAIAVKVARTAFDRGLARIPEPADLKAFIAGEMYQPVYRSYV